MSARSSQLTMSLTISVVIGRFLLRRRVAGRPPAAAIASIVAGSSSADRSPGSRPEVGRPDDASHDLARSRLRQRGHDDDRLGRSVLPRSSTTRRAIDAAELLVVGLAAAERSQTTTIASPLTACGTPIAAASTTAGWATAAASTSAGPTRLPATLSVSSERPWMYQ